MTSEHKLAIFAFIAAVAQLRNAGIVRSHRYLGDLGEFLCADAFAINLATNLRQVGHDGHIEARRVQVKYHGGKSTTVDLGNPALYDEIFVILGPESVLHRSDCPEDFLIYRLSASEILAFPSTNGNYFCARGRLPIEPQKRI
jgi:hypothetical protein